MYEAFMQIVEIGRRIRDGRRALGLTQVGLAASARVSRQTIDRLENGRTPEIGYRTLLRLLNAVGLDLRLTTYNERRPTLEDLARENEEIAEQERVEAARLHGQGKRARRRPRAFEAASGEEASRDDGGTPP
jgi:transcriptional regulator with XRE-family HTH domain